MKNMQELGNPNEDLRHEGKKAYGCRSTAEVAAGSLDRLRLMQRPESTTEKRRGGGEARAVAGSREEEGRERERRMRKAGASLFIRARCKQTGAKIKGKPNNGYPAI